MVNRIQKVFFLESRRQFLAKPRIFISSTFYDLKHVREDIARFVKDLGYETILFERGQVPYGRTEKPEEYCYKEIELTDILLSIIGGRYGSESIEAGYSITQKELRHALELGKQVYIFVEKNVLAEYETYKINKENEKMKYKYADNRKVYEFLDEIYQLPRNNPIFSFDTSQDISKMLKEQWAGLFQRLLGREEEKSQFEIIQTLKGTVSTLQNIVNVVIENNQNQQTALEDIILFNHPAFYKVKEMLNIRYRVVFTNLEELNQLLLARNFRRDSISEDFGDGEDFIWERKKNNTVTTIHVSKTLFDENERLKPVITELEGNLIRLEEYDSSLTIPDDELPF